MSESEKSRVAWYRVARNALDINLLVNAAVRLANEVARIVHEVLPEVAEEEVILYHPLRDGQTLLCSLEIEVDIEVLEELCDGVLVLVLFHLDDAHNVPDGMPRTGRRRIGCFARHDCCSS